MIWELIGAVVGAGLASGREIAAFFARYGHTGYAGIAANAGVMYLLGTVRYPLLFPYRWMHMAWTGMLSAMLVVTGGAMLSGAGEIFALTVPIHGAYWLGQLCTLGLALLLAHRTAGGLEYVSKGMLTLLFVLIGLFFLLDAKRSANIEAWNTADCLISGIRYAGFNAALQASVLARHHAAPARQRRHIGGACAVQCLVLALGTAALQRRPELLTEPLPFLKFAALYGRGGYALFAAALYMAILSTLLVCMKGMQGKPSLFAGLLIVSLIGFSDVVERLYPLLGGACLVLLLCAKFAKNTARAFHSSVDVV